LLSLIEEQGLDADKTALVGGIEFFSESGTSQGTATAFEVLVGVDFPCNSLLIFKLEVNDAGPGPFRIDFELIPSSTTR
jgi:hypothetical protein